jgi:hypothetical protein
MAPSPRASDRSLSTKLVQTFADRGYRVVGEEDSQGLILCFLGRSRYYFLHVTLQFYSRGLVDPVPDPLLRKIW